MGWWTAFFGMMLFAVLICLAFLAAWGTIKALIARHTSHVHPPPPEWMRYDDEPTGRRRRRPF